MRRVLGLTLALVLGGCAHAAGRVAALPQGASYVAMGSSYAAGAGIGPNQPGSPARCNRTVNNYPSLLAKGLGLALTDVSCGGATTAHVLGAWDELPPQIDAVKAGTRLVTITVGGNDLGFVGVLFEGSCRAGVTAFGPCRTAHVPEAADYAALGTNLRKIITEIRSRAPAARIVFIQYVSVMPDALCDKTVIAPEQAGQARIIARRLAEVTSEAAHAGGAEVLDSDTLSRTHTPCAAEPWSTGFYPDYPRSSGAPWHPSAAGHAAIAGLLMDALGRPSGIR